MFISDRNELLYICVLLVIKYSGKVPALVSSSTWLLMASRAAILPRTLWAGLWLAGGIRVELAECWSMASLVLRVFSLVCLLFFPCIVAIVVVGQQISWATSSQLCLLPFRVLIVLRLCSFRGWRLFSMFCSEMCFEVALTPASASCGGMRI